MVIVQPVALTAPRGPHHHRPIKSQGVTIAYRNTSQHIRGPASTAKLRTAPQHGLAHQILAPAKPPAIIRDTPSCARPVAPSEHNGNPTVKKHHIMSKAPYCRTYVTHANQIPAQRTNLYLLYESIHKVNTTIRRLHRPRFCSRTKSRQLWPHTQPRDTEGGANTVHTITSPHK